ncbi:S-adenosyl-L-methionine-dependent methyltransferase [Lentithecium fluviatile CBS 122367]|uniref:S-adenosyl-L-methionine-dependent methyltransferase n=1 Tax=Lentithecium fluviatile CBS 122367 TaxID=1168545 RepID=A0A6G1JH85_9PLEO|nr:S-adenosyl-L-methionine-dependent methyltransferase [Lentithecium fluviatile CBS 122367]
MAFQPKQITKYEASHLDELQGTVSDTAIKHSLSIMPPFTTGDVIHDNACGSGAVTSAIMASLPSSTTIHIDATDINPQFVKDCAALAASNNWPVSTAVMSAQALTFPDNRFTHSFTSFAFHCLGDHDAAAKHVYRTLKPGGTAVASIWISMPHVEALQHAHWRTRGRDGPMPALLPLEGFTEVHLRKALQVGGFADADITCEELECYLEISDLGRWAQLAWSYLGYLATGWSQSDEDRWDEAVRDVVEQLESGDGISVNEKGEKVLRMVAVMAVAKK